VDARNIELVVVRNAGMDGRERRSVSRDVERSILHRVRQGVDVSKVEWEAAVGWAGERQRHIVAMRALAEVSPRPPVFSHWSAGVVHDLPMLSGHLGRVHTTVPDERLRGIDGVSTHLFALSTAETVQVGPLLVTGLPRTIVDISGASPFDGGVMAADSTLSRGLRRELLDGAVDLAGPRRSERRIAEVAGFAHPGAESAAESETRCSMFRLGIAPQELQHEVWVDGRLVAVVDTWDDALRIPCEADGDEKHLNPAMAPRGAGRAVITEKRREDLLRSVVAGLARFGYAEACNPPRLRPVLARAASVPHRAAHPRGLRGRRPGRAPSPPAPEGLSG
jgi:hypothetical protein